MKGNVTESSLEREKFEFDREMRRKEFSHREEEARLAKLAHELEVAQAKRYRWTNPLLVAIVGAIVVAIANIFVANYNAAASREADDKQAARQRDAQAFEATQQGKLENIRAEHNSILEVVKEGEPEKIRIGLCRLVKLQLVSSAETNVAIQEYLHHDDCVAILGGVEAPAQKADWIHTEIRVPGCGTSGCYQPSKVCGPIPANTTWTGATRNFVDSFAGAWGNWGDPATESDGSVCRFFIQHSHNVDRIVGFDFEVKHTAR
jgi:hypothetical protein